MLAEKEVEKVTISEEELSAFREQAADPIREQWIEDMEGQGLPGQELYDLVSSTLEEAKASN